MSKRPTFSVLYKQNCTKLVHFQASYKYDSWGRWCMIRKSRAYSWDFRAPHHNQLERGSWISNFLPFFLIKEFAKGFSKKIINFPIAEEHVIGIKKFQFFLVITEMFFRPFISNIFAYRWDIQSIQLLIKFIFRISCENSASRIVFFTVNRCWKWDLDGSNWIMLRNFR